MTNSHSQPALTSTSALLASWRQRLTTHIFANRPTSSAFKNRAQHDPNTPTLPDAHSFPRRNAATAHFPYPHYPLEIRFPPLIRWGKLAGLGCRSGNSYHFRKYAVKIRAIQATVKMPAPTTQPIEIGVDMALKLGGESDVRSFAGNSGSRV